MAEDIEAFWQNLKEGKDCMTEIPKDRWDWRDYYGDPAKKPIKQTSTKAGLLTELLNLIHYFSGFHPGKRSKWTLSSASC